MRISHPINLGFSLVEILVSLFIVSFAAVNICGLQKMVGEQSRNNFSHVTVVGLAREKFEEVVQFDDIQDLINKNGSTSYYTDPKRGTVFTLSWSITNVSGVASDSPIRDVTLAISWSDACDELQTFTHSEQISLVMLLKEVKKTDFPITVINRLDTTAVNYFESKQPYKKDAYVIYNSQLFQATSAHAEENNLMNEIFPTISGHIVNGWEKRGRIDNASLATLFTD